MDKQPLNTGEQKDMTEFFTDLITKIEEMSQELVCSFRTTCISFTLIPGSPSVFLFPQKHTVKTLFGGVITNNVVSLVSLRVWHKNKILFCYSLIFLTYHCVVEIVMVRWVMYHSHKK